MSACMETRRENIEDYSTDINIDLYSVMYPQNSWIWNVAVYKDLNLEFVTKNSFCHKFAARKCKCKNSHVYNVHDH